MWLLNHFIKFVITSHLLLRRACADHPYMQRAVAQTEHGLLNSDVIKEEEASHILFSQIMMRNTKTRPKIYLNLSWY
jgi:hypothetical protein